MKSKFIKKTAFILAFVMVLSVFIFAACEKETGEDPKDDGRWQLSDEPGRPSTPDGLPEDLDLDGYEAVCLYRAGEWYNYYECEGSVETGEKSNPVYQTVYERNRTVEWRLNCKLEWYPSTSSGALNDTATAIKNSVTMMEYFDFINSTNNTMLNLGINDMLVDLTDAEYIDLSQPWWWEEVNDVLSLDRYSRNFIVGDMHIINITKMSAFYFNTELIQTMLQKDKEYFYNLVDNKEWTIEQLYSLVRTCYKDTTVNIEMTNKRDSGDLFGMVYSQSAETVQQFIMSTRVAGNMIERDDNGLVTMNFVGNEDIVDLVSIMRQLFHESEGSWMSDGFDGKMIKEFSEGSYVFFPQRLSAAPSDYMREMKTDYGILPYPTLEAGDEYISDIQSSSTSLCVQALVEMNDNLDPVSAIIEALCAEAYRYTTVSFYELALKNRYARDDDAARMIDIIYDSAHKSFVLEYSSYANGIAGVISNAILNNQDVTSDLASAQGAAQNSINDFISKMIKGGK